MSHKGVCVCVRPELCRYLLQALFGRFLQSLMVFRMKVGLFVKLLLREALCDAVCDVVCEVLSEGQLLSLSSIIEPELY